MLLNIVIDNTVNSQSITDSQKKPFQHSKISIKTDSNVKLLSSNITNISSGSFGYDKNKNKLNNKENNQIIENNNEYDFSLNERKNQFHFQNVKGNWKKKALAKKLYLRKEKKNEINLTKIRNDENLNTVVSNNNYYQEPKNNVENVNQVMEITIKNEKNAIKEIESFNKRENFISRSNMMNGKENMNRTSNPLRDQSHSLMIRKGASDFSNEYQKKTDSVTMVSDVKKSSFSYPSSLTYSSTSINRTNDLLDISSKFSIEEKSSIKKNGSLFSNLFKEMSLSLLSSSSSKKELLTHSLFIDHIKSFEDLSIHPLLLSSLNRMSMNRPTYIQSISIQKLIPNLLKVNGNSDTYNKTNTSAVTISSSISSSPSSTLTIAPKISLNEYQDHFLKSNERLDVLIHSPTGSGKSLAYLIPILHPLLLLTPNDDHPEVISEYSKKLLPSSKNDNSSLQIDYFSSPSTLITNPSISQSKITRAEGTFAIIITSSRELSIQINDLLVKLLAFPKSSTTVINLNEDDESTASGHSNASREKDIQKEGDDTSSNEKVIPRWIVPGTLLSGISRSKEKARIRLGLSIIISTPGRLLDHLENTKHWKLDRLGWIVLEEADRFSESIHSESLSKVFSRLQERQLCKEPSVRPWQLILVSATLSLDIKELAQMPLRGPLVLTMPPDRYKSKSHKNEEKQKSILRETLFEDPSDIVTKEKLKQASSFLKFPKGLFQHFVIAPTKLRLVSLLVTLKASPYLIGPTASTTKDDGAQRHIKIIIFFSSGDVVDFLFYILSLLQTDTTEPDEVESPTPIDDDSLSSTNVAYSSFLNATVYRHHGKRDTNQRNGVIKEFTQLEPRSPHNGSSSGDSSKTKLSILLTTDVAARGIDFPNISCILQYDPPTSLVDYVHRVGRTARLGSFGHSVLFLLPHEKEPMIDFLQKGLKNSGNDGEDFSLDEWDINKIWGSWLSQSLEFSLTRKRKKKNVVSTGGSNNSTNAQESLRNIGPFNGSENKKNGKDFNGENNEIDGKLLERIEQSLMVLQLSIEDLIVKHKNLFDMAKKGYLSSMKSYAAYPKELKKGGMNLKVLHLGHYAKSFGLKETPSDLSKLNSRRVKGEEERQRRAKKEKPMDSKKRKLNDQIKESGSYKIDKSIGNNGDGGGSLKSESRESESLKKKKKPNIFSDKSYSSSISEFDAGDIKLSFTSKSKKKK